MTARAALPAPDARWAYFLDVDGTLLELASSPALVTLEAGIHAMVRGLHRATGGAVALVSGRALADLDLIFGAPWLPAAGQHGLERRDGAGRVARHAVDEHDMTAARTLLAPVVARHAGLLVEDKGMSLALHYRRAPQLASFAHRTMRQARACVDGAYALQRGKYVVELKPEGMNKGMAVRAFMAEPPFAGRTPVFVGDDATDEDAFATVNAMQGHSVKVGHGPSVARWRLADVAAVKSWLARAVREYPSLEVRHG